MPRLLCSLCEMLRRSWRRQGGAHMRSRNMCTLCNVFRINKRLLREESQTSFLLRFPVPFVPVWELECRLPGFHRTLCPFDSAPPSLIPSLTSLFILRSQQDSPLALTCLLLQECFQQAARSSCAARLTCFRFAHKVDGLNF